MATIVETPSPIAALSVQDAAITGERKSLHGYVTERVLRWAQAEKHIVSRPVLRYMKVLAALGILGSQLGYAETSSPKQNPITAIDIALEPDAIMMGHAEAANARLREVYPKGYALDASVGDVLAGEKPAGWALEAYKYDGVVWNGEGLTVILVKPTPDLIAFQQKLIDAVAPFTVATGTAAAFFTTPEEPDINQSTIDYVTKYVPASSGANLQPHVTVGVAPPDYMNKLITEPFDTFTFAPSAM